jgi:hypothetical protein
MTILESNNHRLIVQADSLFKHTLLTLDKDAGRARLERSILMWRRKPVELSLSEIDDVGIVTIADAASGAETHEPVLHTRGGERIALPVPDEEADRTAEELRTFLGLRAA